MIRAILQNGTLIAAMAIGAVVCGLTATMMQSDRGALGPLVLAANSLPAGLLGGAIAMITATAVGVLVGRVSNCVVGMFALGGALFGLSWRLETVREMVFVSSLGQASIETALWAVLMLAATWTVFRLAGPMQDVEPTEAGDRPGWMRGTPALKMALAGLIMLPAVWIVARTGVKGQVIGAVFVGGTAAGLVGRLVSPHVQPIALFATPLLFGAIGHLVGRFMLDTDLVTAAFRHELSPLNLPMPADYAAGTAMGVAFGLGWAKSFLHHEDEAETDDASAAV